MGILRVSFAELLGREAAAQATERQTAEYWNDRDVRMRGGEPPTSVQRAFDRAGIVRCPPRPAITKPEQFMAECDLFRQHSRCTRLPMWRTMRSKTRCPAERRAAGRSATKSTVFECSCAEPRHP